MEHNTEHSIFGTIYKLERIDDIPNKKNPESPYFKYVVTIEAVFNKNYSYTKKKGGEEETHRGSKGVTEFIPFEAFNMDMSSYSVGDPVKVNYRPSGTRWSGKDGVEKIFGRFNLTFIRQADLDGGYPNHKGKIKTDETAQEKDERIFQPPDPPTGNHADDNEGTDDLPF